MKKNIFQLLMVGILIVACCLILEVNYFKSDATIIRKTKGKIVESIQIAFKPKTGDAIDYTLSTRFYLRGSLGNIMGNLKAIGFFSISTQIEEIKEEKTHILSKINDFKGVVRSRWSGILVDTEDLPEELSFLDEIVNSYKGLTVAHEVSREGKICDVETISSSSNEEDSSRIDVLYDFPGHPVSIGDTWTRKRFFQIENLNIECDFTYKFVDRRNGRIFIDSKKNIKVTSFNQKKDYPFLEPICIAMSSQDVIEESTGILLEAEHTGTINPESLKEELEFPEVYFEFILRGTKKS